MHVTTHKGHEDSIQNLVSEGQTSFFCCSLPILAVRFSACILSMMKEIHGNSGQRKIGSYSVNTTKRSSRSVS